MKKTPIPVPREKTGKPAAVWLDQEDREILKKVGMELFAKSIKPSTSLIVRAALRRASFDKAFFDLVDALLANDGRRVRHQK